MNRRDLLTRAIPAAAGTAWLGTAGYVLFGRGGGLSLLNASYDATRELYRHINRLFAEHLAHTGGGEVRVRPSHGGSGSQARAVIDGLPADVVTLAIKPDLDAIAGKGLIDKSWELRLPNRSVPYTSTIAFVVRKGNPYGVADWESLRNLPDEPAASIVTANPKTSGAAKLGLIACWGSVTTRGGSHNDAEDLIRTVYGKVRSLEQSSRAATVTFARKQLGGVHITWENEARLEVGESGGQLEIVYPSRSIRAEPCVAVVTQNANRNGTAELAEKYLKFLYSPAAQAVIAKEHYRPTTPEAVAEHAKNFGRLELFPVEKILAGGWTEANERFFADGGLFDRIYESR